MAVEFLRLTPVLCEVPLRAGASGISDDMVCGRLRRPPGGGGVWFAECDVGGSIAGIDGHVVVARRPEAVALPDEGASPAVGVVLADFATARSDVGQSYLRGWKMSEQDC